MKFKFCLTAFLLCFVVSVFSVENANFPTGAKLVVHYTLKKTDPKTRKTIMTQGFFSAPGGSSEKSLQKMLKKRFPKDNVCITGVTVNGEKTYFVVKFTRMSKTDVKPVQDECVIADCYTEAYAKNSLKQLWPDASINVQSVTKK